MRRRAGGAIAFAALALGLSACGTQLPNSAFNVLGSGNPLVVSGGGGTGGGTAGTGGSSGTGSTSVGGGSGGSSGSAGSAGSAGHSSTVGGSAGGISSSGTAGHATGVAAQGCAAVKGGTLTVGTIASFDGPFPPDQFATNYFGAAAYFDMVNSLGGICGYHVNYISCNDHSDPNDDTSCAHQLIDQDHVLALVANNVYEYSGASYVSSTDTPDIGGEPITGSAYYTYPHLYAILGSYYPNNGQTPSTYYGLSGLGIFFKNYLHITKAGVVYYAQTDSQRGAAYIEGWLSHAGIQVDPQEVPLLGDPSSQVQAMKNNHDQAVFDSLDLSGNQHLCAAMQSYTYNVPKISTISVWSGIAGQYIGSYPCANSSYAWGETTNYADSGNPQVALFQKAYGAFQAGKPVSQWSLEGWAAAMWFSDAVRHCAANLTKSCVESFVDTKTGYAGNGLLDPNTTSFPGHPTNRQCYTIVKWDPSASSWSTVADHSTTCYTTSVFSYS